MRLPSPGRIAAVLIASAFLLITIGWLARAPYTPRGSDDALLRLSWRFRPDATETCRPRTEAELEALPIHMRTPEVCEDVPVTYRVIRQLDDAAADTIRVLRGGLRQDRPVYVLLDTALAPASYRLRVQLTRERDGAAQEAVLPPLDVVVVLQGSHIALVTLDSEGREFVVRTPGE